MEKDSEFSASSTWNVDVSDPKYVSQLSAILVATIQEAKDRISQIEYAFCNQLYPYILARSKNFRKELDTSLKEAEETWRVKEKELLKCIEILELQKRDAAESEKRAKQLEDENWRLNAKVQDKNFAEEKLLRLEAKLAEKDEVLKIRENEKSELTQSLRVMEEVSDSFKEKLEKKDRELCEERAATARLRTEIGSDVDRIANYEKKVKLLNESCKKLRSENNFLRKKLNLTQETMVQKIEPVEKINPTRFGSGELIGSLVGPKRGRSDWVNTRARERRVRGDPHDDFLDTPLEEKNKRVDGSDEETQDWVVADRTEPVGLGREEGKNGFKCKDKFLDTPLEREDGSAEETQDWVNAGLPEPVRMGREEGKKGFKFKKPVRRKVEREDEFLDTSLEELKNKRVDGSDEETQERIVAGRAEPVGVVFEEGKTGYKFNEPVRAKGEREKLKGVECKQCSKFYDVVLPDRGGDVEGDGRKRCEHDDGVSRHRYRYVPPCTPEGFWNIGFDTEM